MFKGVVAPIIPAHTSRIALLLSANEIQLSQFCTYDVTSWFVDVYRPIFWTPCVLSLDLTGTLKIGFKKLGTHSSFKASSPANDGYKRSSKSLKVPLSNKSGWFKSLRIFGGARRSLQRLLETCKLITAIHYHFDQNKTALAVHNWPAGSCPKSLPDLSHGSCFLLQLQCSKRTLYSVGTALIALITIRLHRASFKWETRSETEIRACSSHQVPLSKACCSTTVKYYWVVYAININRWLGVARWWVSTEMVDRAGMYHFPRLCFWDPWPVFESFCSPFCHLMYDIRRSRCLCCGCITTRYFMANTQWLFSTTCCYLCWARDISSLDYFWHEPTSMSSKFIISTTSAKICSHSFRKHVFWAAPSGYSRP